MKYETQIKKGEGRWEREEKPPSPFPLFLSCFLLLVSCLLLLFFAACSKKPVQVGRDNPEKEITKCIKLSDKKRFKEAVECMEVFKSHFPKSQWGVEAELYIGDNYFRQKEYLLAADSYQSFIKLNPTHPKADYAYYKSGLSYLKQSPKAIDRDQEYLDNAIADFEIVQRSFPDSTYINVNQENLLTARKRVAEHHFYIGRFYYKTGEYLAAIPRFQEIVSKYKDSGLCEKSLYYTTIANLKLDKLDSAKEAFSTLSLEYSKSKYIKKLENKLISASKEKGL